jgi:uncharacterized protein YbjT (DUF2867 family)
MSGDPHTEQRILLTGATGYVGGRLLCALEKQDRPVRCLARSPHYLHHRCSPETEVVQGDVLDPQTLEPALRGIHTAFYLVHALGGTLPYAEQDRLGAQNFATAAARAGVRKIVYLGGLGSGHGLSTHLSSRQEVGEVLRSGAVPTLEFRASIIIGSGSLSYEMVRIMVQKLPIMITPRWVRTLAQPIAIEDVVAYLLAALDLQLDQSRVYEIGGADRVAYEGIMREYASIRGLRRLIIPAPLLTPHLSGLWLTLVTPLYYRIGRHLIEGVRNETIVQNDRALTDFAVRPMGIRRALQRAIENEDHEFASTHWSDALGHRASEHHWGGIQFGTRIVFPMQADLPLPPDEAFSLIRCLGGNYGWHRYNFLWKLRGMLDQLLGGVGHRRGRPRPTCLNPGAVVDFWRVEAIEPGRMLRLAAEMKLPGRGWLQFDIEETATGSRLTQTAIFDPLGLFGLLYWYGIYPLHILVFRALLHGITNAAISLAQENKL